MKIIFRLFAYIQYLLIRLVGLLYEVIPPMKAYDIGAAATGLFYPLLRKRRRIAMDNIMQAGITESTREADRIARVAFGHLGGHICEAFKVGKIINRDNWREHIIFECSDESRRLVFEEMDQPFILLTGHLGTWEAGVSIISLTRPMIAVARKMNNAFIERFMRTHHFRGEITIIDKNKGFTSGILREWKRSAAALTIVMDQHAGRKTGVRLNFMGREAGTHTSPARLHLRSGMPVIVGAIVRDAPFKYKLVGEDPIRFEPTGNRDSDLKELLTIFNSRLEKIIRKYPEQYLWAHKRWRKEKKRKHSS